MTTSYNTAGQPVKVVPNSAYVYAQSGAYGPTGQLSTLTEAAYSNFSISLSQTFNNRLEPANITVATPGGQVQNVTYGFTDANGNNNGNVMSITNNLDGTRSPTYTYDSLNRIKTAGTSAWSQNFSSGIDRWGNLSQVTATGGAPTLSQTMDTSTNRFKTSCAGGALCYDAAGNMTSDGLYNYAYDAEGPSDLSGGSDVHLRRLGAAGEKIQRHNLLVRRRRPGVVRNGSQRDVFK